MRGCTCINHGILYIIGMWLIIRAGQTLHLVRGLDISQTFHA